jgi:PAS domain S-box-containing protein
VTIPFRLNIFQRIAAGYGLVLLILIVTGFVTFAKVGELKATLEQFSAEEFPTIDALRDLTSRIYFEEVPISQFRDSTLTGAPREALLRPYYAAGAAIQRDLEVLATFAAANPAVRSALDDLKASIMVRQADAEGDFAVIRTGVTADLTPNDFVLLTQVQKDSDKLSAEVQTRVHIEAATAEEAAFAGLLILYGLFLLGALTTVGAGILIARSISRPIGQLTASAQRIAAGENIEPPDLHRTDEIGRLSTALARMVQSLRDLGAKERSLTVDIAEHKRVQAQLHQEIAVRELADHALRASEERYRGIVQSAYEGIWLIDAVNTTTFVNPRMAAMLGYTVKDLVGRPLLDFLDEQSRKDFIESEPGRLERHGTQREVRFTRKDGSSCWTLLGASPTFDEAGAYAGALAMVTDITEHRKQAEELKRSNAELEQFASIASHDLQEPLRMVASYTGLLKRRYQGKLDADADEFIGFAVDGVTRMQALINDLLMYSRAGSEPQPSEPTDSGAALDRALRNLETTIQEKGALVHRGELPSVMSNPGQLTQVFQNLIANGIKFCRERRPEVTIGAERKGTEWVFSVRDNGIGIDPSQASRIFLIFQRLHKREEYPGTGIGLAICRKIVERHGGRIWVESKPGEGATFYFTIRTIGGQALAA